MRLLIPCLLALEPVAISDRMGYMTTKPHSFGPQSGRMTFLQRGTPEHGVLEAEAPDVKDVIE